MLASEIVPCLFVGSKDAAQNFLGEVICVLEQPYWNGHRAGRWMPILDDGVATRANLDRVAFTIERLLMNRKRVLVHCGQGVERSPLAVAWYLRSYRDYTLDDAYALLKRKRPEVEDHRAWLEPVRTS